MPPGRREGAEPKKRPVTVTRAFLFSDLRGYTNFVEVHGDLAAADLLRDYRTLVRGAVARHAGGEVKTEGDSFYVVFTSALAALDCAVSILREAEARNRQDPDGPLHIGIGVHAGEVVPYDEQFVGSAVNIAARLASKAHAGEILVSDTLRGLVRAGQSRSLTDRGRLRLKGVGESVRAWHVDWEVSHEAGPPPSGPVSLPGAAIPPGPSGELVCPIVVGREEELARLVQLLADAAKGERRFAVVAGEAGVGKTAVAREATKLAVHRGFKLLWGAALESETGLPYRPFVAAMRSAEREEGHSALRRFVSQNGPDATPLFPELGRRVARAPATSLLERHRIAVAFQQIFHALSKDAPLLIVLDDLQWSDEASLALIGLLVGELAHSRIAFLGTYRGDDVQRGHPLLKTLATLRRDRLVTELTLDRLGAEGVGSLLEAIFKPHGPVGTEFRDAIYERAEGNPFFTEELLRSLAESGRTFASGDSWTRKPLDALRIPGSIREVLVSRVEQLSPEAETSLAAASVIGVHFGFDLLRRVREVTETDLARHIRECVEHQLALESGDVSAPTYAFRHALTREVVYERLLLPERRVLHLRVASALLEEPDVPAAVLAQHWKLGGDRARAAEAYEAAGLAALEVYAPAEAVAHFESAIESRGETTVDLYEGLARAYLFFDYPKSRVAAERALASLPGGSEHLERRVALMQIAGRARRLLGDTAGGFELAGSAIELVKDVPESRAAALAYDWFAGATMARGDRRAATGWAEKARHVAAAIGDYGIEASALTTIATCISSERPKEALDSLDQAAAKARRAGAAEVMARVHTNGIVTSFAAELERPRFVRIERAIAFSERYRYGRELLGSYRAFHRFSGLDWPAEGFGVAGGWETNLFVAWVRFLEELVTASRAGPTAASIAQSSALTAFALRQDDPPWAVPWLAYEGLLLAWAQDLPEVRIRVDQFVRMARRLDKPDLELTVLPRGDNLPAALLCLAGDRERLVAMTEALADLDGYAGARDMLQAFISALDGDQRQVSASLAAAVPALEQRGLRFTIAVDLWAIATRTQLDARSDLFRRVDEWLERAGAAWLRSDLLRLARVSMVEAGQKP